MSEQRHLEQQIIDSWRINAAPWIRAVRNHEIQSRRLVTDAAIVQAVMGRSPVSVLDLGCGEGWLGRELGLRGVEVVGVDVVPELIESARGSGDDTFLVMSYEDVARGRLDVRVDVVVCNFSLMGAAVVDDLVAATPKLLNDGGALVVQTLHPVVACGDHPYVDGWRNGSWDGFSADFRDPAPWYFRTTGSWVSLLRSAGFSSVETMEPIHPDTKQPASLVLVGVK
jgi:2-polyprenyl-3-methyl-5-hydroxy-6-metoxy-1,4-benzoquinol methylase